MKFLFIHQNFPAQFKYLAPALAQVGHDVRAIKRKSSSRSDTKWIQLYEYRVQRSNATDIHPWALNFESKVIRGEAVFRFCLSLRDEGYAPDVIIAHPGWGESLFIKEVWPNTRLKLYCEFFYASKGLDTDFDPEFQSSEPTDNGRIIAKNASNLLSLFPADDFLSPTEWQANTFPPSIKDRIEVIHDGIDTERLVPADRTSLMIGEDIRLNESDEIITYVSRSLEPYRGFHMFMRSLPSILAERPLAKVIIVGKEPVSYGGSHSSGQSWKKVLLDEIGPLLCESSMNRIFFVGTVNYDVYLKILQLSDVHVYLTYPFVLSWSLLEAMSVGCAVVASDTGPVKEVVSNGENGLLVDFFNREEISRAVVKVLEERSLRSHLGRAARQLVIGKYDLRTHCLPRQIAWAEQ